MLFIKHLHASFALLSIIGFILRAILLLRGSPAFNAKFTRIAPHIVDTLLLASALTLLWVNHWNPFEHTWLIAKILGLIAYIALGLVAFRFAKTKAQQSMAIAGALFFAFYIVFVAISKSPLPF